MPDSSDPWDWDTDKVVQELCTDTRSWNPPSQPPKLPNLERLEASLRDNEVDGETFLGAGSDAPDFYTDLGVKAIKHKETIRSAITQWRRRSRKYKIFKLRRNHDSDESDDDIEPLDQESRKRKLADERRDDDGESVYSTPPALAFESAISTAARRTATPTVSRPGSSHIPTALPLTTTGGSSTDAGTNLDAPPVRKKRRIAPISLSSDVSADAIRTMPVGNLVSEVVPAETTSSSKLAGGYLGTDVFNRADIYEIDFDAEPLSQEDQTFVFVAEPEPQGRRRQRGRLLKRRLAKWQHTFRPAKADMVPGSHDPEHYNVLPAYGESDDEYDSDTWNEIQKEEDERKNAHTRNKALSDEQKGAVLDQIISERKSAWTEDKLPKLERRANRIWNRARRQGLKLAISRQTRLLQEYEERMEKYRREIVHQQWATEAEIRKISGIFDQTVEDLQHTTWMLGMLKSPTEPKKLPQAPRKPKANRERPTAGDDEEILTSDSDTEDYHLRNFIVDDDPESQDTSMLDAGDDAPVEPMAGIGVTESARTPGSRSHEESSRDEPMTDRPFQPDVQSDATSKPNGVKLTPSQNTAKRTDFDTPMASASNRTVPDAAEFIDLTQLEPLVKEEPSSSKGTPADKGRKKNITVIDLVTPEKGKQVSRQSSASRNLSTSAKRLSFQRLPFLELSPMQLKGLSKSKRLVHEELNNATEYRDSILSFAAWDVDDLWGGCILQALEADKLPKAPFQSDKEKDIFHGLLIIKLWDTFLGQKPSHWRQWFAHLQASRKHELKEMRDQFTEFVHFLRDLSLSYQLSKVPVNEVSVTNEADRKDTRRTASSDGLQDSDFELDEKGEAAGRSKAKKRKPVIVRNKAAMSLRESDVQRVKEQAERREAMRAKIALLGPTVSQRSRLIINESKEDDQAFVYVPDNIAAHIKDHQISGVRFLWNQVVIDAQVRQGCLLAHTMGLGKTMQIITLLMAIADSAASNNPAVSSQIPDDLKESRTLILAPPSLVENWMDELLIWTNESGHHLGEFFTIHSKHNKQGRHDIVDDWSDHGGILVIGYQMFKSLLNTPSLAETLLESPNVVVADEAHMLKNPNSKVHQVTEKFRTQIRIALTGSPLANNVQEYHSMINWVAPNYLSNLREFRHDYAIPIETGLTVDSTPYDRRKALVKLRSLKETVAPKVHRRTIHSLKDELPPKVEFVISVPLTDMQFEHYEAYIAQGMYETTTAKLFATLGVLTLLCNHPACFRQRMVQERDNKEVQDELTAGVRLPSQLVGEALSKIPHTAIKSTEHENKSWKIPLLVAILEECRKQGDSVLVFSQSISTLDYLEQVIRRHRFECHRLDGRTQMGLRQSMVKEFNQKTSVVFLISTTAGGMGLNITGANRVIIFDFKFNPQHEQQAVGRAFRLGQTKPVFVYKFICGGTFEEKLHSNGVFKMQLAQRVVDKKNPIPRGQKFSELFAKPETPLQKDLDPFRGKDKVLDSVLDSELGQGIRSIVMADTFEEENLEEENLTQEEQAEAQRLIAEHKARITGKALDPLVDVSLPVGPGFLPVASAPSSSALSNGVPNQVDGHTPLVPSNGVPDHISGHKSLGRSSNITQHTAQVRNLTGAPHPSFQAGAVQPILGPSTHVRQLQDQNHGNLPSGFWDSPQAFKGELGRMFSASAADEPEKNRRRQTAHNVAAVINQFASDQDRDQLSQVKWALVDNAKSHRFVEAIVDGKIYPPVLASCNPRAINELRQRCDNMSDEQWRSFEFGHEQTQINTASLSATVTQHIGNKPGTCTQSQSQEQPQAQSRPQNQSQAHTDGQPATQPAVQSDPEAENAPRDTPATNEGEPSKRKSHKDDDQVALQELRERRDVRGKEPRLPTWAREAVASQGRHAPSSSMSPGPSFTAPRRAKNPFL
ncbi:uncharacterized protein JN550_000115 [Neoarthrinium moseri]|uniref:uncharacterized protein n=1 Tax=Neoarthrinium moseri TaxID=1658444 RepID=UPI001FDCE7F4|nr:uncharacterized protein JN550_000115 [Neoarthrinium moseri]KAI1877933.1 hypothetical protein JN550_000115 [Neoarthrinium moseri]